MSTLNVDTIQDKGAAFEHARLVQVVSTQTGAVATGTSIIPGDDTIPQKTEGDEYMTLAITPTHASNKLLIEVHAMGAVSAGNEFFTLALFQDTTANALAAIQTETSNLSSRSESISLNHYMTTGTTSSTTFKVRMSGASGTFTFNGNGGSRLFGGVMASTMTISEIRV